MKNEIAEASTIPTVEELRAAAAKHKAEEAALLAQLAQEVQARALAYANMRMRAEAARGCYRCLCVLLAPTNSKLPNSSALVAALSALAKLADQLGYEVLADITRLAPDDNLSPTSDGNYVPLVNALARWEAQRSQREAHWKLRFTISWGEQ